ncbi:MAG: hypothetical protein MUO76_07605 [Anaerolineaceae bacterium]|nr:hypothetical protein [Anaerolineaceae bacterium]
MTSRQRVIATLNHQEPDRMPVDMMGTAGCLEDSAYFKLRDHLGLEGNGRQFRKSSNVNYYDDRVLEKLGVDFRRVWMRAPINWQQQNIDETSEKDEWGMIVKRENQAAWFINEPLSDASVSDLETYPWPDPYDPGRIEGLKEEAKILKETTGYAISARQPTPGIFELAQRLRGSERFLMDLILDKKFAIALVHKIKEVRIAFFDSYLNEVGEYIQMVETADDYGAQNGPLISPKLFDEIFLPARKEMYSFIKKKAPNVKIFMHSDGGVYNLIKSFIETGVDVLNPVEPDVPGNDSDRLKKEFGKDLVFHGHLNNKGPMRGSLQDIQFEVERIKNGIAHGGGYIFAPTNHFQRDVPPENIIEAYRLATSEN